MALDQRGEVGWVRDELGWTRWSHLKSRHGARPEAGRCIREVVNSDMTKGGLRRGIHRLPGVHAIEEDTRGGA